MAAMCIVYTYRNNTETDLTIEKQWRTSLQVSVSSGNVHVQSIQKLPHALKFS